MKLPIHLPLEAILVRGVLAPTAAVGSALITIGAAYVALRARWAARTAPPEETMVDLAAEERAEALFV